MSTYYSTFTFGTADDDLTFDVVQEVKSRGSQRTTIVAPPQSEGGYEWEIVSTIAPVSFERTEIVKELRAKLAQYEGVLAETPVEKVRRLLRQVAMLDDQLVDAFAALNDSVHNDHRDLPAARFATVVRSTEHAEARYLEAENMWRAQFEIIEHSLNIVAANIAGDVAESVHVPALDAF